MNRKAISPVVAVTMFLIVAVVGVISFQTWFSGYLSKNLVEVETNSNNLVSFISAEEDTIFLNNVGDSTLDINYILLNGRNCGNGGSYNPGVVEIDLDCDFMLNESETEVIIVSSVGVFSYDFYVDEPFTCDINTAEGFAGGDGSLSDPFEICNCSMLQNVRLYNSTLYSYELINDIDCSMTTEWNSGEGFYPLSVSGGVSIFDGKGNSIRDLYINRPTQDDVGLFSQQNLVQNITNLALLDVDITGNDRVGGIAGRSTFVSNIINSYVTGTINGSEQIGPIQGYNHDTDIINSYSLASVSGSNMVGGIIGSTRGSNGFEGRFNSTFGSSTVTSSSSEGGLIGELIAFTDIAVCSDFYWNNLTTNPNIAVGDSSSCGFGSITTIQDDDSYFYDKTNLPMSNWDEADWSFRDDRFPKLKEKN